MSRSLLAKRLSELEAEGLVDRLVNDDRPEYHLTRAGEALRPIVIELGGWGKRWVGTGVSEGDLDAGLLMWDVQRRIERAQLPEERTVVCFRFTDAPAKHQDFWLVLEQDEVDLCLNDPGYDEDLYVTSNVETFTRIWLGDADLNRAVSEGAVELSGPSRLRRAFPRWLGLSMFASIPRERRAID
jgi:hypothetical protein